METALASAVSSQIDFLNSVFKETTALFRDAVLIPQLIKQQSYLDRLQSALPSYRNPYAGLADEQIKTQNTILYGMMGLIALVIIAAMFKRSK